MIFNLASTRNTLVREDLWHEKKGKGTEESAHLCLVSHSHSTISHH